MREDIVIDLFFHIYYYSFLELPMDIHKLVRVALADYINFYALCFIKKIYLQNYYLSFYYYIHLKNKATSPCLEPKSHPTLTAIHPINLTKLIFWLFYEIGRILHDCNPNEKDNNLQQ